MSDLVRGWLLARARHWLTWPRHTFTRRLILAIWLLWPLDEMRAWRARGRLDLPPRLGRATWCYRPGCPHHDPRGWRA